MRASHSVLPASNATEGRTRCPWSLRSRWTSTSRPSRTSGAPRDRRF